MSTTTPAPPRLLNTVSPAPEHHEDLQSLLDRLVQDTGTSYGVVFGTHGLHLFRSGNLDQVGAERVTAILTNVLLLSRGAGNITERGEAETIVVRPTPVGVPGELYIGGAGLARGYHNRPELTRERFVPNPFDEGRLYRTGDIVRRLPTGDLEFLSRRDTQVKVRGFRVEPSEIESKLTRHPGVGETVVIAREDTPGDRRLVAYLVPTGTGWISGPELREFLLERLPAHMVPSFFVALDELPVSPNGKVDRASLPRPVSDSPGSGRPRATPENAVERTLSEIWADVIGLERVGVHDNFFEIGGDSILSIQIVARAAREGINLTAMDVFHAPTIAEQARIAEPRTGVAAEQHAVTGPAPTTPVQRWFLEQDFPDPHHWNMAVLLRVCGPYGAATLRRALDALLEHHDGLRQRFDPARPDRSEIGPPDQGIPFETVDLGGVDPRKRVDEINATALRLHTGLDPWPRARWRPP